MNNIKSLEQIKKELQHSSKDKIIEMFYNTGLKLVKIENRLKQDIEELEMVHDNYIDANVIEGTYETLGEIQYARKILKILEEGKEENDY